MRLTNKSSSVKQSQSNDLQQQPQAKDVQYIDWSNKKLLAVQNLDSHINLRHLIVKQNQLSCLLGLERCKELWRIDASNNKVKNLDGLSKFVAQGTLNLDANDFNWIELEKIRHLHLIELIASNNPKLEKDGHYRKHLIDCLPNVWMIDGLLVTSVERQEVVEFFNESALSAKPVRHKLPKYQFVPTDVKVRDAYGEWSTKMFTKFAVNEVKTIETDVRRLQFVAGWFEEVIVSDCKFQNVPIKLGKKFLRELIEFRKTNLECCNMILILLVASLEFKLPIEFLKDVLEFTRLNKIGESYETCLLFELPRASRIYVSNLLLSAVKIDRDMKIETGFYENLFVSIRNILDEIYRNSHKESSNSEEPSSTTQIATKDNKCLLATEILQLFCIVPSFYNYLPSCQGLESMLTLSINDPSINQAIYNLLEEFQNLNKTNDEVCAEMSLFITRILKMNARQLLNKKAKKKRDSSSNFLIPATAANSQLMGENGQPVSEQVVVSTSRVSPKHTDPIRSARDLLNNSINMDSELRPHNADLGESLLIGYKKVGKIVQILSKNETVGVKFETSISNEIESNEQNIYQIDLRQFEWDELRSMWRPKNSTGDMNSFFYDGEIQNLIIPARPFSSEQHIVEMTNSSILLNLNQIPVIEAQLSESARLNQMLAPATEQAAPAGLSQGVGGNQSSSIENLNINTESMDLVSVRTNPSRAYSNDLNGRPLSRVVNFKLDLTNASGSFQHRLLPQQQYQPPSSPSSSQANPSRNSFHGNKLVSSQIKSTLARNHQDKQANKSKPNSSSSEFVIKWGPDESKSGSSRLNSNRASKELDMYQEVVTPLNEKPLSGKQLYNSLADSHFTDQSNVKKSNEMIEINLIKPPSNEKSVTFCEHCDAEKSDCNNGNHEIITKLNSVPGSRPSSPVIDHLHKPPPKIVLAASNNLLNSYYNYMSSANLKNTNNHVKIDHPTHRKKIIKVQDCTTWLSLSTPSAGHQRNGFQPVITNHGPFQTLNAKNMVKVSASNTQNYFFTEGKVVETDLSTNRINVLLSRKTGRVNTNPKMPVLTSPSSKAHMMCRGLRPNNLNFNTDFNLISKRIEIDNGNK